MSESYPKSLTEAAEGSYLAAVYLTLANLAYVDEKAWLGARALKAIREAIPKLPDITTHDIEPSQSGRIVYEWGAATDFDANLLYVVSCRSQTGDPLFVVVVVRGTDVQTDPCAQIRQMLEDLQVGSQLDWAGVVKAIQENGKLPDPVTQPCSTSAIAHGSAKGLRTLLSLTDHDNKRTLVECLNSLFPHGFPAIPLIVTGHSLGGCQATVVAQYLHDTLKPAPTIVPNPWAAPTAGNQAFASAYDAAFPKGYFWWNTLDVVPNSFSNLCNVPKLWPGIEMTPAERDAFYLVLASAMKCDYAQPASPQTTLVGKQPTDKSVSYIDEVKVQHFPNMYAELLAQQTALPVWPYLFHGTGS